MSHAKLLFHPHIVVAAESVAQKLQIEIEQADQLLSRPDTHGLLEQAMAEAFQDAIFKALLQMRRVPHERVPVRVDSAVALTGLALNCREGN